MAFDAIDRLQPSVNVASMIGLGSVRAAVVGEDDRPATPAELLRMVALGAHGVLLGRAWAYALAAGGGAYVTKMLWTMQRELSAAMAMAGRTRIADVDRTILDR